MEYVAPRFNRDFGCGGETASSTRRSGTSSSSLTPCQTLVIFGGVVRAYYPDILCLIKRGCTSSPLTMVIL